MMMLAVVTKHHVLHVALTIKFHGEANVRWSEQHGSGKDRRAQHYMARETYFDYEMSVFGKGNATIYSIR